MCKRAELMSKTYKNGLFLKKSVQKSKNPYFWKNLYLYGQIRTSGNTVCGWVQVNIWVWVWLWMSMNMHVSVGLTVSLIESISMKMCEYEREYEYQLNCEFEWMHAYEYCCKCESKYECEYEFVCEFDEFRKPTFLRELRCVSFLKIVSTHRHRRRREEVFYQTITFKKMDDPLWKIGFFESTDSQ